MRRLKDENGYALIMLMAFAAVLIVLAAAVLSVTLNTQHSTAAVRTKMAAFDYAQAGLQSALVAIQSAPWPTSNATSYSPTSLAAAYSATYPSGPPLTVQVYDDQYSVDQSIWFDQGSPVGATTKNSTIWVQASVTYNGNTARVRQQVKASSTTNPGSPLLAGVAVYSGQNVVMGQGNGSPGILNVAGGLYAGGSVAVDSNATIDATIHAATAPYLTTREYQAEYWTVADHIVPPLTGPTGAFPDSLVQQIKTQASVATQTGTLIGPTVPMNMDDTVNPIYTTVYTTGDLSVGPAKHDATCNFQNLWVQGNLTISNDVTFTCQNLHVGGNLTVTNVSSVILGNATVGGNVQFGTGGTSITAPTLVVGGNFTIESGMHLGSSSAPCMLLMTNPTSTNQTFAANGGSFFTGVVANLSPGGVCTFKQGDRYTGSVFSSGQVTMLGDAQITFDANATGTWTTPTTTTNAASAVSQTWQELSPSGQ